MLLTWFNPSQFNNTKFDQNSLIRCLRDHITTSKMDIIRVSCSNSIKITNEDINDLLHLPGNSNNNPHGIKCIMLYKTPYKPKGSNIYQFLKGWVVAKWLGREDVSSKYMVMYSTNYDTCLHPVLNWHSELKLIKITPEQKISPFKKSRKISSIKIFLVHVDPKNLLSIKKNVLNYIGVL